MIPYLSANNPVHICCVQTHLKMLQVAYVFTTVVNTELKRKTMFLDHIVEEAKSLGIDWRFVSFEDRAKVDWREFHLVTFSPVFAYVPQYVEFKHFLQHLDESGIKCANPSSIIIWNSDKKYLLELEKRGVPIPSTVLLKNDDQNEKLKDSLAALYKDNDVIVVKPTVGASGQGVRLLKSEDLASLKLNEEEEGDHLAQEFVPEILSLGETSYVFFDEVFSHAARKTNPRGDFRVQTSMGGVKRPEEPSQRKIDFCRKVLGSVPREVKRGEKPLSYARVDFLEREKDGELLLMELELVEPQLFLTADDVKGGSVGRYLRALLRAMSDAAQ